MVPLPKPNPANFLALHAEASTAQVSMSKGLVFIGNVRHSEILKRHKEQWRAYRHDINVCWVVRFVDFFLETETESHH